MSSTNCFTCREKSSSHRQINSLRSNPFSRVGTSPSSCVFNFIEEKSRPPKKERKKKSCFVSSLMWFVFFFIFFFLYLLLTPPYLVNCGRRTLFPICSTLFTWSGWFRACDAGPSLPVWDHISFERPGGLEAGQPTCSNSNRNWQRPLSLP